MTQWKCEEDGTEFEHDGERGYCPNCGRRATRINSSPDDESGSSSPEEDNGENENDSGDNPSDSAANSEPPEDKQSNQGSKMPQPKSASRPIASKRGGTRTVTVKQSKETPPKNNIAKKIPKPQSAGRKVAPTVSKKVVTNKDRAREHENEYETTWTRVRKVSGFGR